MSTNRHHLLLFHFSRYRDIWKLDNERQRQKAVIDQERNKDSGRHISTSKVGAATKLHRQKSTSNVKDFTVLSKTLLSYCQAQRQVC